MKSPNLLVVLFAGAFAACTSPSSSTLDVSEPTTFLIVRANTADPHIVIASASLKKAEAFEMEASADLMEASAHIMQASAALEAAAAQQTQA